MTAPDDRAVDVRAVPGLDHEQAMALAATEVQRVLALVDSLTGTHWTAATDCPGWTVRDVLGHLLGMWEVQADPAELRRQVAAAAEAAARSGRLRLDELTDVVHTRDPWMHRIDVSRALGTAPVLSLDAVDFCRVLSGRGKASGLLARRVPF
jgi:hypothetical protein